jgi:hypothetical protein
MARFLTKLITREVCEIEGIYALEQPLVYESDLVGRITVPTGFRTDFASVPRLPLTYLLAGGKGNRAAVIHDFLYSGGRPMTRKQADAIFKEALEACGYGSFTVWLMHTGVRLGGEASFKAPNLPQPRAIAETLLFPTPVLGEEKGAESA